MKDLIIIGGGPAGITAAVYAARKKMDFTVISKDIGGQAAWSSRIENYTGFQFIPGPELVEKFRAHLEGFKFELLEGVGASDVARDKEGFSVRTDDGKSVSSRTLVIATGKKPRDLGVPGESQYKGKGVHSCATCDGALFAGKTVAVVGGGNSALDSALSLVRIASKIYIINIAGKLTGDRVMQEKLAGASNVEIMNNARVTEVRGDRFVTGVVVEQGGARREIPLQGVFVEVGLTPNSGFIKCVKKNSIGEIIINCSAETSCEGVFAAGDVTSVPDKQIIIAAGDGAKAALSAFRYLSTH